MTHELTLRVGSPHVLRDHIAEAVVGYSQGSNIRHTLEDLLAQVADQLPTHIEEPTEFGSIVRAGYPSQPRATTNPLWQRAPHVGDHYWINEYRDVEVWSELTDVEVLRVGVGDDTDMTVEEFDRAMDAGTPTEVNVSLGRTYTKTIDDGPVAAYAKGVADVKSQISILVGALAGLQLTALTAPEKRCYGTARDMVAALLEDA